MSDKKKILLDTDLGDDIDDALALALALKLPDTEIIGITTVFKYTILLARATKRLIAAAERRIPVYAGFSGDVGVTRDGFSQYESELEDVKYICENESETTRDGAIDFIVSCAEKYGKELTIVAIGPLTNIAAAIRKNPETMKKVRKISLMGGSFYKQVNEWNFACDPKATDVVFRSGIELECYGLDVTMQVPLSGVQFKKIISYDGEDELLCHLAKLMKMWHAYTGNIPVLHDPLTLFAALYPGYVFLEKQSVEVIIEGELRGFTINKDRNLLCFDNRANADRIYVAKAVADGEFLEKFFEILYK